MDSLDMPEAYDELSSLEKEALAYWIDHAMCGGRKYSTRTSYGIKHDFEREGFYLTNGQFKGAMLAAGYTPEDPDELNWTFKIKPVRDAGLRTDPEKFAIGPHQPNHQRYAQMLAQIKEHYRAQSEARAAAQREGKQSSPLES